ncbi:MAG: acyl-[Tyzzerella sp.]|nr:acyl-[acyl-carrier-protein] thioesterase [Tyzzerella sp.]
MYKMQGRVRYSECGIDNQIKIPAIINYFQDCTTENSETIGVGHHYLVERKRAWILNSWQVEIMRRPQAGESIEVSTWATDFKGVFGPRDFCMETAEGEELARAHSLWVYIDTESGKPVKPTQEEIAVYEVGAPISMEEVSRKIKVPEGALEVDTFPVHRYHIDTNAHVNNSKYIELACEGLSEEFEVQKLRVEYKKAAVLGDRIVLKRLVEKERIVVELCDKEGSTYAIVEFMGE